MRNISRRPQYFYQNVKTHQWLLMPPPPAPSPAKSVDGSKDPTIVSVSPPLFLCLLRPLLLLEAKSLSALEISVCISRIVSIEYLINSFLFLVLD